MSSSAVDSHCSVLTALPFVSSTGCRGSRHIPSTAHRRSIGAPNSGAEGVKGRDCLRVLGDRGRGATLSRGVNVRGQGFSRVRGGCPTPDTHQRVPATVGTVSQCAP